MAWAISLSKSAVKDLKRIDRPWQRRILDHLQKEIAPLDDPRTRGKALKGEGRGLWRYRVGDYRIICDIRDDALLVLALRIQHRGHAYRAR